MGRQINASDTCQVIYPYSCGSVFPEPVFTTVHNILCHTPIISSIIESLIKEDSKSLVQKAVN